MNKIVLYIMLLLLLVSSAFALNETETNETSTTTVLTIENDGFINELYILGLTVFVICAFVTVAIVTKSGIIGVLASVGVVVQGLVFMLDSTLLGVITVGGGLLLMFYFALMQS